VDTGWIYMKFLLIAYVKIVTTKLNLRKCSVKIIAAGGNGSLPVKEEKMKHDINAIIKSLRVVGLPGASHIKEVGMICNFVADELEDIIKEINEMESLVKKERQNGALPMITFVKSIMGIREESGNDLSIDNGK
jgi:hypothetical protein